MLKNITKDEAKNNPNLIVPIAFDDVFKEVFGKEENINALEYLVSILLDIPYDDVKGKVYLKSNRKYRPNISSKKGEKDIVFNVDISKPFRISLEMNKYNIDKIIINRNILFHSDVYVSGIKESDPYTSIPTTIQFNLNPDYIDMINKPLVDEYYYRNKYNNILTPNNKIVHINVAKMSEMWYSLEYKRFPSINPLLFLISTILLENEKVKFDELVNNRLLDKKIGKMIERIVYDMNDEELLSRYYSIEDERERLWFEELVEFRRKEAKEMAKDMAKDMAKEMAKDMAKEMAKDNINNIIINLYQNDVPIETIKRATGLSIDEINQIIKSFHSKKK